MEMLLQETEENLVSCVSTFVLANTSKPFPPAPPLLLLALSIAACNLDFFQTKKDKTKGTGSNCAQSVS